jgi:hypothetical protein
VFSRKNLRKKRPRPTCKNITKKNKEAPFKCKIRKINPKKNFSPEIIHSEKGLINGRNKIKHQEKTSKNLRC